MRRERREGREEGEKKGGKERREGKRMSKGGKEGEIFSHARRKPRNICFWNDTEGNVQGMSWRRNFHGVWQQQQQQQDCSRLYTISGIFYVLFLYKCSKGTWSNLYHVIICEVSGNVNFQQGLISIPNSLQKKSPTHSFGHIFIEYLTPTVWYNLRTEKTDI